MTFCAGASRGPSALEAFVAMAAGQEVPDAPGQPMPGQPSVQIKQEEDVDLEAAKR